VGVSAHKQLNAMQTDLAQERLDGAAAYKESNRKLGVCYAASGCESLRPRPGYQRSKTP
jgi:hypothetical protein